MTTTQKTKVAKMVKALCNEADQAEKQGQTIKAEILRERAAAVMAAAQIIVIR